jgi:hypothetical protein
MSTQAFAVSRTRGLGVSRLLGRCVPGRSVLGLLLALCVLLLAGPAHADMGDGFELIGKFENKMVERITAMLNDPTSNLNYAAARLFYTLALALFVWKAVGWALRGFDLHDMIITVCQIFVAGGLMASFPIVVPALFTASLYIGNSLLAGLAGISSADAGEASVPIALMKLFGKYSFTPDCGAWAVIPMGCVVGNLAGVMAALSTGLVLVVLGIASLLVDVWGFWGFGIALAIGSVLVPFMLYERLSFLFDGWVRFFFGFLVYTIVARVNLALVAIAILTYQSTTVAALLGGTVGGTAAPPVKSFGEIIGMLMFAGVGVFTLAATGAFARSMVMGAGGGGVQFSAVARNAAGTMAGAATGLVTAGTAAWAAGSAVKAEGGGAGAMAKAAAGGAAGATVDAARQSNPAFAKGYTVGREAAAGAISGAARGMKFGADPMTPTGGGVKPTVTQRAQAAIGGAIGGASAAARTTAALAMGLKVNDSFAEKRQLVAATERANEVGFRAAQALDEPNNKIQGEARAQVSRAVENLNEKLKTSTSAAEVRTATDEVRAAMAGAGAASALAAGANAAAAAPAPAAAAVDPYMAAALAEIEKDERERYDGLTFAEYQAKEVSDGDRFYQEALSELEQEERDRNGGQTFAEAQAQEKADEAGFQQQGQAAVDEWDRGRFEGLTFAENNSKEAGENKTFYSAALNELEVEAEKRNAPAARKPASASEPDDANSSYQASFNELPSGELDRNLNLGESSAKSDSDAKRDAANEERQALKEQDNDKGNDKDNDRA